MNAIKMKRILINICKYVLLIFAAFVALVPIVSCIFTAFKTSRICLAKCQMTRRILIKQRIKEKYAAL